MQKASQHAHFPDQTLEVAAFAWIWLLDSDQVEELPVCAIYFPADAGLIGRVVRGLMEPHSRLTIGGEEYCGLEFVGSVIDRSGAMESATFRKWLVEQGCRIDAHEHPRGHEGHVMVTVHREARKTRVPLGGSRQALDPRVVRRVCEELGLDPSQLPGPKSRV